MISSMALATFLLLCNVAFAADPSQTLAPPNVGHETAAASVSVKAPDGAPQIGAGQTWRFKRHEGLWWYWLPSEKWVIWNGDAWVPYSPEVFAELRPATRRQATYYRGSSAGYPEAGKWGPVRYNSYGQREYPYSRRNSGIRQLGPVPAMGGVRAMPGWGGER
jgi:hypothetical protein